MPSAEKVEEGTRRKISIYGRRTFPMSGPWGSLGGEKWLTDQHFPPVAPPESYIPNTREKQVCMRKHNQRWWWWGRGGYTHSLSLAYQNRNCKCTHTDSSPTHMLSWSEQAKVRRCTEVDKKIVRQSSTTLHRRHSLPWAVFTGAGGGMLQMSWRNRNNMKEYCVGGVAELSL